MGRREPDQRGGEGLVWIAAPRRRVAAIPDTLAAVTSKQCAALATDAGGTQEPSSGSESSETREER
jgi:hypothetical protein